MNDSDKKSKAIRLVEYLTRLASLSTKTVRDVTEYQDTLWIKDIPELKGCFTRAWDSDDESNPDVWIEVQTRREPEVPIVPPSCKEWIDDSTLRNKSDLPELSPEITRLVKNISWNQGSDQQEYVTGVDRIEEHPETEKQWERYVEDRWLPWSEEHNDWQSIQVAYSELFAIHQEQLRRAEEYELVLGIGLLTWLTPTGQRVHRHMIVANAVLEFEARLGKFTVRSSPSEGARVRPELDMLDIEHQPALAEETAKSSLAEIEDDPWDGDRIEEVLRALVNSISSRGEYDGRLVPKTILPSDKPIVEHAPALILRKRSEKGLTEILRRVKDNIENDGLIPSEFEDLSEIRPDSDINSVDDQDKGNSGFDGEIFFPKQSNEEQRRIVEYMRMAGGILVQGPPGTGKSHTIANLISHLLATGQRTLITAKTPRALQVLERLVPEELRPLCINLLGSGHEERKSLESSVGGILRKNGEWDNQKAIKDRKVIEKKLCELREDQAKTNRRLRSIKESETHDQSIAEGVYRGTAARIAEAVNRDKEAYEWFPDIVQLDQPCPISGSELRGMLESLRGLTTEKRRELDLAWPASMPSPEKLSDLFQIEHAAYEDEVHSAAEANRLVAEILSKIDADKIEEMLHSLLAFQSERRLLASSPQPWISQAIEDITGGNPLVWSELSRVTREVINTAERLANASDELTIDFPDETNIRMLLDDARRLIGHFEAGGKIRFGLFRPKVVKESFYVLKTVLINGRRCTDIERLIALANALHVRIELEKAWEFWEGRCDRSQGPYVLQLQALISLCDSLDSVLSLPSLIKRCRRSFQICSLLEEPSWPDETQVETYVATCRLALAIRAKLLAAEEISSIQAPLQYLSANANVHPITGDSLIAIRNRDVEVFTDCYNTVQILKEEYQAYERLELDINSLRQNMPKLTMDLEQTSEDSRWATRCQQIQGAWHWAQAKYWLEEYIKKEDESGLAKRATQIEDEINANIAMLASIHAWTFCFDRLNDDHRRHMEAWQQSMRRLGKGTGRHAPRHRREAQKHLNECREAVPAWVMPLHRIWDTVDPSPGMFDVIIVDEASQCGIEALPLLYLGKKILIVGDDRQISPEAVGVPRDAMHRLMEEYLYDFRFKSSFDVEASLFDHGKLRYGTRQITLREHFRCMPEIIRFSNDLSYSDTPLIPLRQHGPNRLTPLEHVFVAEGYREGSNNRVVNRPEASALVDKIAELCVDRRYSDKTMGVIVLQGEAQARLIEGQLLERLGAEELERRGLRCGNSYHFQGDERDIMFLSMVAAPNQRIGPFTGAAAERRFNVAASRACDQMYLFHSVRNEDLSADCLRRRLLEFFENTIPQEIGGLDRVELEHRAIRDNRSIIKHPMPFDSWFEVDVALELARKGFDVIPQYEIAGRKIDLVIEGGNARLAVEVDGDVWHGPDRYEADMQRQRQLERCGWEFYHVRESAFYSNKEVALRGLWQALKDRDIFPRSSENDQDSAIDQVDTFDDIDENTEPESDRENSHVLSVPPDDSEVADIHPGRSAEEITVSEIQEAVLQTLSKSPNQSCTMQSVTSRVLKELGVRTRGNPRMKFERRVMRVLTTLEKRDLIETYKAKNRRIRLIQGTY
jgi:very-short-patch-repair endonuclease